MITDIRIKTRVPFLEAASFSDAGAYELIEGLASGGRCQVEE